MCGDRLCEAAEGRQQKIKNKITIEKKKKRERERKSKQSVSIEKENAAHWPFKRYVLINTSYPIFPRSPTCSNKVRAKSVVRNNQDGRSCTSGDLPHPGRKGSRKRRTELPQL